VSGFVPTALSIALTLGSPVADKDAPPDFNGSLTLEAAAWQVEGFAERTTGQVGWGYSLDFDQPIDADWRVILADRAPVNRDINRQRLTVARELWRGAGLGAGLTVRRYKHPHGALALTIPLPGGGFSYLTDFKRAHVAEAGAYCRLSLSNVVEPFLELYWLRDRVSDWKAEMGIRLKMKKEK
jgi:hypothetical protein